MPMKSVQMAPRHTRKSASMYATAFALAALAVISPVYADVNIYQNVFEGEMLEPGYSYYWENCFQCHAYGSWGAPVLQFAIYCDENSDGTVTTTLIARDYEWPAVPLDTYWESPVIENSDSRAAWIVETAVRTKISVSNTVYASSVFKNELTGQYIPEVSYSYTGLDGETKYLYMCY